MTKGSGTVRYAGYRGEVTGKGMRNKRKTKKARKKREEANERMRSQREKEVREESWLEEWGHLAGDKDTYNDG